jgi:hypothetical protein
VFPAAIGVAIVVGVVAHEIRSWRKPRTFTLDGAAPTLVPDTWTTRGK